MLVQQATGEGRIHGLAHQVQIGAQQVLVARAHHGRTLAREERLVRVQGGVDLLEGAPLEEQQDGHPVHEGLAGGELEGHVSLVLIEQREDVRVEAERVVVHGRELVGVDGHLLGHARLLLLEDVGVLDHFFAVVRVEHHPLPVLLAHPVERLSQDALVVLVAVDLDLHGRPVDFGYLVEGHVLLDPVFDFHQPPEALQVVLAVQKVEIAHVGVRELAAHQRQERPQLVGQAREVVREPPRQRTAVLGLVVVWG